MSSLLFGLCPSWSVMCPTLSGMVSTMSSFVQSGQYHSMFSLVGIVSIFMSEWISMSIVQPWFGQYYVRPGPATNYCPAWSVLCPVNMSGLVSMSGQASGTASSVSSIVPPGQHYVQFGQYHVQYMVSICPASCPAWSVSRTRNVRYLCSARAIGPVYTARRPPSQWRNIV